MDTPLRNTMRVGIVFFMAYPVASGEGPVIESLNKILQDEYFDFIEITWIKDEVARQEARRMLEISGIEAAYAAQPRLLLQKLDLNSLDEDLRKRSVDEMKAAVDDCQFFGLHDVALLSGPYPGDDKRGAAMDALERSLVEVCAYATGTQTNIVLEVFDRAIDKKCLIGQAADAREIAERVCAKHSNFGLMVDLSHIPLLGESPRDALVPTAPYIRHIHIGNCAMTDRNDVAYGDMHPRFGYPAGENDVDEIVEFLRVLFEIGYLKENGETRPVVSFEVKPQGTEPPDLVVANSKRKLNAAWARLRLG